MAVAFTVMLAVNFDLDSIQFISLCIVIQLDHAAEFALNIADEIGGGAYLANTKKDSRITSATFEKNVATTGGALAVKNCRHFKVGNLSQDQTILRKNSALEGGALHIVLQSDHDETFEVSMPVAGDTLMSSPPIDRLQTAISNPTGLLRMQQK